MYNTTLRALCIKNEWFTCGTNDQYDKLFQMNDDGDGVGPKDLALMIWTCSYEGFTLAEIEAELVKEGLPKISTSRLQDSLREDGWGEAEIDLIYRAVHGSDMNGTEYVTI